MNENAKRRKFFALFGIAALLLVAQGAVMVLLRDTPEKAVRAALDRMAAKAAELDAPGVGGFVSRGYRGEIGADADAFEREIASAFGELKSLKASVDFAEIHVEGDTARAVALFYVSGEFKPGKGSVYPRFAGIRSTGGFKPEAVYLELRLEGEASWRVDHIDWKVEERLKDFPSAKSAIKG